MTLDGDDTDVKITTSQEFCDALGVLLADPTFPEENVRTGEFLEAMKAWLEAVEGRNTHFDNPEMDGLSWSDLYKLMRVAAAYE